ncbi:hypothetical protein MPTK2_7g08880 [Marchantia polymorpha subsp. ruderalis]
MSLCRIVLHVESAQEHKGRGTRREGREGGTVQSGRWLAMENGSDGGAEAEIWKEEEGGLVGCGGISGAGDQDEDRIKKVKKVGPLATTMFRCDVRTTHTLLFQNCHRC